MKRILMITCVLILFSPLFAQTNIPVEGISDVRPGIYGLTNASVISSYDQEPAKIDILIVNGLIKDVGKNLEFPDGTRKIDLDGKTIYPSFVDIYTSYGVPVSRSAPANPMASYMAQSQRGATPDMKPRVADYWNQGIHENFNVSSEFIPDTARAAKYRKAGFGAVVTFRNDGIARGTSALVSLGDDRANNLVLKDRTTTNYSFSRGTSEDRYPTAQYGAIALLRQMYLDAQWYEGLPEGRFFDASLEALSVNKNLPKVFEVSDKYEVLRADAIGDEFGIQYIVKGSGNEYQLIDEIKKADVSLIIPLKFPDAPDVKDPYQADGVSLSILKHWEMAPANAAMVSQAGIEFAVTTDGLSKPEDFLKALRKAVEMGLDKKAALKASTYTPAKMVGADQLVGAIKTGMVANLLVTSGDIFDKECIIYENWVEGKPYVFTDPLLKSIAGNYSLTLDGRSFEMKIQGQPGEPTLKVTSGEEEVKSTISYKNDLITISLNTSKGMISLSGAFYEGTLKGDGLLENGQWSSWRTEPLAGAKDTEEDDSSKKKEEARTDNSTGAVIYPFVAYGWEEKPVQENILFKNGTVWTLDQRGRMEGADVLVTDGKIAQVGIDLKAKGARIVDATGLHITPGIIDEHSHIAMASTNEVGQAITSEVRVGDVIDPADNNIYRQLSGGVTAAHLLHGSANPVGGQSIIIKHRWGSPAADLKIEGQVGFLKHALGENVKRRTDRYPNSRMGAEHMIRDAYQRALDYRTGWQKYNALLGQEKADAIPPRRDLELEALVDVLEKRSFMTCHTYVQSEGMMIMKLAEDFGFKAHTLIHFNEAYKIADKMREHGAAGSVFSDWWDYKYEVYEGITYNAATLVQQGVLTCLHSDNAEMSRRLNQEAGKIVKYGGIDQVEALKLVTLNPAKILHLDQRMGSIEPGKDADLVLWSDNPLSVYARAKMTLVDGIVYFDEAKDAEMKQQIDEERNRIIQKILKEGDSPTRPSGASRRTY